MSKRNKSAEERLSPSEFMRKRRPELYSDSKRVSKLVLDQKFLEYSLETLTSRKEEIKFEYFCRKLLEREVCPNLIPQTGPTGGGDSKTDSETFQVSEQISERWYVGDPARASKEKWDWPVLVDG